MHRQVQVHVTLCGLVAGKHAVYHFEILPHPFSIAKPQSLSEQ